MNVSIDFPAEIEQALQRKAAAAGLDVAAFVQHVVAEELAELEELDVPPAPHSHQERMAKLQEIINRHPRVTTFVDDSRESIYAGCGE